MKRVFIIHQWMSGPDGDWRPWLKSELQKKSYEVFCSEMPDMDTPVIEKWVHHLSELVGIPDKETYFVGHSIGCQTILRYLENVSQPVGGAVFVAGWFDLKNLENEGEEIISTAKPWIETPINLKKVKGVLPKSTLIISDNDPYNAFEENKKKFSKLCSKIVVLQNAGHITAEDGFTKLPIVLYELESII